MGRNGSGKSSLLWALQGAGRRRAGAVDVGGADPAGPRRRRRRRRWWGWCRRPPPTCSTSRPSAEECARPTGAAADRRLPRARSTGWCPASTATTTRATSPRASGSRSRSPSCSPPRRRWCCSTSRPAASTTPPRRALAAMLRDARRRRATRVLVATHDVEFVAAGRRPTWSCWPRARSSPTGPIRRGASRQSPAFAPQVTKVLGAAAGCASTRCAAALRPAVTPRGTTARGDPRCARAPPSVLARGVAGRADDARAGRCCVRVAGDSARVDPPFLFLAAAAGGDRGRAGRGERGRHGPAGAGHARRAVAPSTPSCAALAPGTGRHRAGLLPADPRPAGSSARASASCSAAPRCSPRR